VNRETAGTTDRPDHTDMMFDLPSFLIPSEFGCRHCNSHPRHPCNSWFDLRHLVIALTTANGISLRFEINACLAAEATAHAGHR
jgi:hypothetical protein